MDVVEALVWPVVVEMVLVLVEDGVGVSLVIGSAACRCTPRGRCG